MKTLGTKLALGYAITTTVTLFGLQAVGYYLLSRHLGKGIDPSDLAAQARVAQVMDGYAEISLSLVCIVLVTSVASGLLLGRVALRPLRRIEETANRIHSDNLGERIPVAPVEDEISSLSRLLNEMFDRIETSFHQVRRFSSEVSHELKTPLSLLRLQSERLLADGNLKPEQEEAMLVQLEEIARMNQTIEGLLFLSRAEARAITLDLHPQNPREFLQGFLADARILAEEVGGRLEEKIDGDQEVRFDARSFRRVLLNLVSNAVKVTPPGGLLTVESEFTVDSWQVAIEDEGPGVRPEERDLIFKRFVRLDQPEAAEGSGLGLAICWSIVEMHRGQIRAEEGSRTGGLRVVCEIPLRPPNVPAEDLRPVHAESID